MRIPRSLSFAAIAATCILAGAQQTVQPSAQSPAQPGAIRVATTPAKLKTAGVNRTKAAPAKPAKPPWLEFKLNPKTTMLLDFSEADPNQVISLFARTSGITILKDPSFKTPLTFSSAKSVKVAEAFEILDAVLKMDGYELKKQGKLLVVGKPEPAAPPMPPPGPVPQPGPPAPGDEGFVKV